MVDVPMTDILYPVIVGVPEKDSGLTGRGKVAALSRCARRALIMSAELSGYPALAERAVAEIDLDYSDLSSRDVGQGSEVPGGTPVLEKDHRGAPVPHGGVYWALAHKPHYAAAVCAPFPVGIDIEEIAPRKEGLFNYIAGEEEWKILGGKLWNNFFRVFTAKEAVLKTTGDGISGLSKCLVAGVVDDEHVTMSYNDRDWLIEHYRFGAPTGSRGEHIAAITAVEACQVTWTVSGAEHSSF